MKRSTKQMLLCGAALIGTAGAPFAVHAQPAAQAQPAANQSNQLEEVVVTARRREEILQNIPVSVSALSGATLDRRDIRSIDDVAQFIPNVSSVPSVAFPGGNATSIRGIGEHEVLVTGDSPVGEYLDGVYIGGLSTTNLNLVDVQRIEVLRGPQGTLFGRNTTGGAINVVTKTPDDTFGIEEKIGYAGYNEFTSRTAVNTGEIGSTGLKAIIAYQHRSRDGYVNNVNAPSDHDPGAIGSDDAVWAKLHGDWDALGIDYTFDYDKILAQTQAQQLSYVSPLFAAYYANSPSYGGATLSVDPNRSQNLALPRIPYDNVGSLGHALTIQYEINPEISVKSITGYRNFWGRTYSSETDPKLLGFTQTGVAPIVPYLGNNDQRLSQESEELQVLGNTERWKWVGGLYYFHSNAVENEFANLTFIISPVFGFNTTSSLIAHVSSESEAAFGQASYTPPILDDKLELTGGLRFTKDTKAINQTTPIVNVETRDFYNLSYNVTANYKWTPDFMTYLRIASGYRSGGYNLRAQPGQVFDFQPEKATVYEGGFKSEWFNQRLRANVTGFYTDYSNLQVSQFNGVTAGAAGGVKNANANYKGFEAELQARPLDGFTIDGSLGYVHPEYDQIFFPNPVTGKLTNYAAIAKFPYVPEWTNHVGVQYEFPIENIGAIIMRADYTYESAKYFFTTDLPTQNPFNDVIKSPGHNLVAARVTLTDVSIWNGKASMETSVYGENLLNEHYLIQGVDYGPALGFATMTYGIPRRFGFDLKIKY